MKSLVLIDDILTVRVNGNENLCKVIHWCIKQKLMFKVVFEDD